MIVVDVIDDIVKETSLIYGSSIFFFHDHIQSISEALSNRELSREYAKQKYPCIMLLQDFSEDVFYNNSFDIKANLQLLIVANSYDSWDANIRLEKVYKPVLYPIYNSFIKALQNSTTIQTIPLNSIKHQKIDRLRLSNSLNEVAKSQGIKAIFNDYLDGIEIRNLNLIIKENCNG